MHPFLYALSGILFVGSVWFFYSNELYQELIGIKTTKNIFFQPNEELYPHTTKLAIEKFNGNVNMEIAYIQKLDKNNRVCYND